MGIRALFCIATLVIVTAPASATIIHVDCKGGGEYFTIGEGISYSAASEGDTVLVAPGTYTGPDNRDINPLSRNLVIISEDGPETTIINCEYAGYGIRYCNSNDPTSVLDGFTIANASARAIDIGWYSSPTVRNCIFSSNTDEDHGGGLCVDGDSSPTFTECVFSGNWVDNPNSAYGRGGGAYIDGAEAAFANCTFSGNEPSQGAPGGGVYIYDSSVTFTGCTFSGNETSDTGVGGGACIQDASDVTFTDCTFAGNWASSAGALYLRSSSITVTGCMFSGNEGKYSAGAVGCEYSSEPTFMGCTFYDNSIPEATGLDGGALVSHGSCPTIGNCTFIRNSSPNYAAGIYMTAGGSAVVTNTVIAFSTDGRAAFKVGSGDPTFTHCVVWQNLDGDDLPGTQHDNLAADPRLCNIYIGNATVCANSLCLSGSPDNPWGEPVGAHGQGCGNCKSPARDATWGAIKRMYR